MGAVNDGTNPDALSIWTYDWHFDPSLGPGIQGNGVPVLDRIIYPEWLDEADQMRPAGHPASIHGGDITVGTNWWDEIPKLELLRIMTFPCTRAENVEVFTLDQLLQSKRSRH